MARLLLLFITTFTIYSLNAIHVQAITVYCTNCSDFVNQQINNVKQAAQYVSEVATQGATQVTAVQQTIDTINNKVLLPLQDFAKFKTLLEGDNFVEGLITGAQGNESLMIRNPEGYSENEGNKTVKRIIDGTPNGFYGPLMKDYLTQTFSNTDVDSRIKSLAQSSIPSTIQNNLCDDTKLTARSIADVQKSDGTYDQGEATARKTALYNNFCKCDPVKDQTCAKNLTAVSNQDPSVCGTDCLFKITNGGENAYSRAIQTSIIAGQEKEKTQSKVKADLTAGGGIKSKTDCPDMSAYIDPTTGEAALDENNNPVTPPIDIQCGVSQTSAGLRTLWEQHLKSPQDSIRSSFSGLGSFLSAGFTTLNLLNGISGAIGTIGGGGSSGGGAVRYSNPIRTSYTPDLTQNPQLNEYTSSLTKNQFSDHLAALNKMENLVNNYVSEVNLYKSQLERIPGCYTQLVDDFASSSPNLKNNVDVVAAQSFYTNQKSITDNLLAEKTSILPQISATRSVINDISGKITASQSTDERTDLFNEYQNKMDDKTNFNLIGFTTATISVITLKGDLDTYTQNVQTELADTGNTGKIIARCSSLRTEEQAKIDALTNQINTGF